MITRNEIFERCRRDSVSLECSEVNIHALDEMELGLAAMLYWLRHLQISWGDRVGMGEGRHQGNKLGITRSKYIRYAVIRALIQDGYPLDKITDKFQKFYAKENQRVI